jgi:hypothetical protein
MSDLETQVGKLLAAEEIKKLKAVYADACDDDYNPARMRAEVFTEDATWEGGTFGRFEGIDEICEFFANVSSSITWALHYMIAPAITVADDLQTATGSWYIWMPFTAAAEGGGSHAAWVAGRYYDEYRREAEGWRISNLKADIQIMSPYDDGWVKTPMMG